MPTKRAASSRNGTKNSGKSSGTARTTTNHDKIRKWAEERGAHPATVRGTSSDTAGVLRLDFPGYRGQRSLKEISWDEFFEKFDEKNLAFLYQEKTVGGRPSRFGKFVERKGRSSR